MNPERNLPTICEIIHLQANDLQKLEDTNPAIKEKIANINSLLQKPTTILISDLFSLPTNQNPRVLGGRIREICVAIRFTSFKAAISLPLLTQQLLFTTKISTYMKTDI